MNSLSVGSVICLLGVYDILPHVLWTNKFLDDQGLQPHKTIIYQDNTSSILLEKNGHHSSSCCTKHMDVWYFYITNHVKNKGISIQHYPTEEMLTDVFTKPLQGSLFLKLQTAIMGHGPPSPQQEEHRSVLCNHDTNSEDLDSNLEPNSEPQNPEPVLASNALGNAHFGLTKSWQSQLCCQQNQTT